MIAASLVLALVLVVFPDRVDHAATGDPVVSASHLRHAGDDEAGFEPRLVYRYSVVRGGVHTIEELGRAVREDPVVRAHYAKASFPRMRVERLAAPREAYVSYRIADTVYWTKRPVTLPAGELVLTDGSVTIRARCGNRLSDRPLQPVFSAEPAGWEFDQALPEAATDPGGGPPISGDPGDAGAATWEGGPAQTSAMNTGSPGRSGQSLIDGLAADTRAMVRFPDGFPRPDHAPRIVTGPSRISGRGDPLPAHPTDLIETRETSVADPGSGDPDPSEGDPLEPDPGDPGPPLVWPPGLGPPGLGPYGSDPPGGPAGSGSLIVQEAPESDDPPAHIPEPASLLLLGSGLAAYALRRHRMN